MFAAQFPEDSCGWCVLLTANQLLDTRDICCSPYWPATTATNDSIGNDQLPSTGNPASIVLMSRSRLDLHQALLANSFRKRRELQFFSTCNAFITILSSRVILPIKMHKRGYYSTVLFYKTGSYSQNIIINANTNKY